MSLKLVQISQNTVGIANPEVR